MKKSVILIIAAVYILSVCIVGFFGIKMRMYNETINVESITITSVTLNDSDIEWKIASDGTKAIARELTEPNAVLTFKVYYEVLPLDATDKTVDLVYQENDNGFITVSRSPGENAFLVTFNFGLENAPPTGGLKITVRSSIFNHLSDSIMITIY